jgi:hypothetical protein
VRRAGCWRRLRVLELPERLIHPRGAEDAEEARRGGVRFLSRTSPFSASSAPLR